AAERWIHFGNYIIRDDATGQRFADALVERARSGVRVRVLYDALGSLGTARSFWRRLVRAGVEVRAFNPLLTRQAFNLLSRDHRKLLVVDGGWAMLGGLCSCSPRAPPSASGSPTRTSSRRPRCTRRSWTPQRATWTCGFSSRAPRICRCSAISRASVIATCCAPACACTSTRAR